MYSNLAAYRAIAEEANAEAQALFASAHSPMPQGSLGVVITYDPSQRSFRQCLVAITFAAIYLDALLYVVGKTKFGEEWGNQEDRMTYEQKLVAFEVQEQDVLEDAKRLRMNRNGLVHEKAVLINEGTPGEMRWAHEEAAQALSFISRVSDRLRY